MTQKLFSIELKIYLISALLLFSACSGSRRAATPFDPLSTLQRRSVAASEIPVPPWMVWRAASNVEPILSAADDLASEGMLEEALIRYQDLRSRSQLLSLRRELVVRELGTLLQMGRSQRVLEQSARFLKEESYSIDNTPSGISLMVGYAYLHQGNNDQAIAWFTKAINSPDPGRYSAQAKKAAVAVVRSIPNSVFSTHAQRWQADSIVGKLFVSEKIRRSRGGAVESAVAPSLFSANTYRTELPALVRFRSDPPEKLSANVQGGPKEVVDGKGDLELDSEPTSLVRAQRKIGVLLPLSGQYAEHALKVKHGIMLAAEQALEPIEVVVGDTKGDPAIASQAYNELVSQGVAVVLGPLLVKTTEQVAANTLATKVPIISFTKRTGVPQLGPYVFRLGVTLENQISELLSYGVEDIGASRFAILYPANASGEEYSYNFSTAASRMGVRLVASESYYPGDENSVDQAVVRVSLSRPDAVFVPDQLDFILPLLNGLEKSESADAILLGPALWDDPVAIRGFGQLLDGAVYVTPFYRASSNPKVVQFLDSYRKRFDHTPELLAAQAFDAAQVAISAIDRGLASQTAMSEAIEQSSSINGVTGRLSVSSDGEIYRQMSVLRLFKGEVIEVKSQGVATGFVPGESRMQNSVGEQRTQDDVDLTAIGAERVVDTQQQRVKSQKPSSQNLVPLSSAQRQSLNQKLNSAQPNVVESKPSTSVFPPAAVN